LALKESANCLKHSKLIHLSYNLISKVTDACCISFSLHLAVAVSSEGAIKLFEALSLNSSLTSLYLGSNSLYLIISFSLNTGNAIGSKGAIQLSEALKSNSTLTSIDLYGNGLVASFHSNLIQEMILAVKEEPNYLKHSNPIQLLLNSISSVTDSLFISYTLTYCRC
jgi:hypothetical protein